MTFWNEEIETKPVEELKAMQLELLQKLIERTFRDSGFYRKKMDEKGVKPEDIDGSGLQGLKAQMIIHAAIESLNTGRVVYLDEMFPNYI